MSIPETYFSLLASLNLWPVCIANLIADYMISLDLHLITNLLDFFEVRDSFPDVISIYSEDIADRYSIYIRRKENYKFNDDNEQKYDIRFVYHKDCDILFHNLSFDICTNLLGLLPKALHEEINKAICLSDSKSILANLKDFETKYRNGIAIATNRYWHERVANLARKAAERIEKAVCRGKSFSIFAPKSITIEYKNIIDKTYKIAEQIEVYAKEVVEAYHICYSSLDEKDIILTNEAIIKANQVAEEAEKANDFAYKMRWNC